MKKYAIILAGGQGTRLDSKVPKQFIEIDGLPILLKTIEKFYLCVADIEIIVVLPENQLQHWEALKNKFATIINNINPKIIIGGQTRFQSAKNAFKCINKKESLIAIHDAARPFVSDESINKSFEIAKKNGNAVCAVASKDSIRVNGKSVNRTIVSIIQTPQTFHYQLLEKAYDQEESTTFTDDASIVEALGYEINLVEGNYENIKITTQEDLVWAEVLAKKQSLTY